MHSKEFTAVGGQVIESVFCFPWQGYMLDLSPSILKLTHPRDRIAGSFDHNISIWKEECWPFLDSNELPAHFIDRSRRDIYAKLVNCSSRDQVITNILSRPFASNSTHRTSYH